MTTFIELMDDFSYLSTWEEKYQYLIELGGKLEPLPPEYMQEKYLVSGCQSQVWFYHYTQNEKHYFKASSDAFIVRGLIYILLILVNGKTTKEIKAIDFDSIFNELGLIEHLSPSRRNGFLSMIQRIKKDIE